MSANLNPIPGSRIIDLSKVTSTTRRLAYESGLSPNTSDFDESKPNSPTEPSISNAVGGTLLTPMFDRIVAGRPWEEFGNNTIGISGSHYIDLQAPYRIINHDIAYLIAENVIQIRWQSRPLTNLSQVSANGTINDVLSLSRVSKTFNLSAIKWIYRDVILDFELHKSIFTTALLTKLLCSVGSQKPVHQFIHKLTVSMPAHKGNATRRRLGRNVLKAIIDVVSVLTNLSLFW